MANKIPYLVDKIRPSVYAKESRNGGKRMVGIKMYAKIQDLKTKGYKKQRAARELDIDVKTVRKYWDMNEDEYASYQLDTRERTKIMDKYHDFVLDRIINHPMITSAIIDDNLREKFPEFGPSYRSVRLYVCQLRESEGIPTPLKIRQYAETEELPLGLQAQVDMGQKTMTNSFGSRVKIYIFAMVLSNSRHKFVYFQDHPFNTDEFIKAHDLAFRFYGGRTAQIVYDQDRVMVVDENAGDIIFTEKFRNYCNYAGFSVHLCRGSDPESKGKVEAVVKYVKNNFLAFRTYHGINALNSEGLLWLDRCANGKIHDTTKMIPKIVFREEAKHLKPAPTLSSPILPREADIRKTNVVHYKQNRYSMPKGTYTPGRKARIEVCEEKNTATFYDSISGEFLETHEISTGIGKYVSKRNVDRFRETRHDELLKKVLEGFGGCIKATEYISSILKRFPRYARDQLRIVAKLQDEYNTSDILRAVDYCLDRSLISATDFRDTLLYFKQEVNLPVERNIQIPLKYRIITADSRPLSAYENLSAGGDSR